MEDDHFDDDELEAELQRELAALGEITVMHVPRFPGPLLLACVLSAVSSLACALCGCGPTRLAPGLLAATRENTAVAQNCDGAPAACASLVFTCAFCVPTPAVIACPRRPRLSGSGGRNRGCAKADE
jgi:hypothetical protein